jgi:tRNA pseudouridine55 synthase
VTDGPEGLLLIDKVKDVTSHDVVDMVRRALGVRKVGHAGTLDPLATGLLILGVGRATRLLRFLSDLPKTYRGRAILGVETTTLDADGDVTHESAVTVSEARVRDAMRAIVGPSMQTPPAFSAVKVGGRKLYEAARQGERLEAAPRPIRVDRFDLLGFDGRNADFEVTCSSGTYVRVLAADVGEGLGCGAHLGALRRLRIGPFDVAQAVAPEAPGVPQPIERAIAHLPRVDLLAEEAIAARHGRVLGPIGIEGPYAVFDPASRLVGIYEDAGAKGRPKVILAE